ncbi:DUF1761 domain-containing protein [Cellulophaga baltica]|uniref:DUF1761 domain-containing protein n=1 Tax=Cellulophaga baltica TaxID=76594 RepID=UPI002147F376|nr:DUF1761 domain-containing protein [Cellulophaga baltica]MCR1027057.1 DUF1761 domain-containing protein [Cellulophaga baltica]
MTELLTSINWLGVLSAFIPYFMLGALWFTLFFKKQYAISLGKENSMPEKPAPIFIIGPAICSLIITITTAILIYALNINSYQSAIEFAFVIGLGYLVANTMNIAINPNIPKPIMYGIISGLYHLVGIIIVCIIIFAMK